MQYHEAEKNNEEYVYILLWQDLQDMLKAKYRLISTYCFLEKKVKMRRKYVSVCKYINTHWKDEKETNKTTYIEERKS